MKTSNKIILLLLGTFVFLLIASMVYMRFFGINMGDRIVGTGVSKHEVRTVTGFSSVLINGDFTTTISQGETFRVEIDADENILQQITTELSDDQTLFIGFKKGTPIQIKTPIHIHIQAPDWTTIGLHGSGDLRSSSTIQGSQLEIESNGSSDIKLELAYDVVNAELNGSPELQLSGSATSFSVQSNGSGDVLAEQFMCNRVSLFISGSGDALVHADSILNVQVNGSGNVTYTGNAGIVNSKMYGSGELNKR
ncbi:MAG: DUF2807 domain-containing protein [Saprospiraceae bacterium]|nr:DUF2807 domain-containing protein [Saprospiraceae bacterium]